MAKLSRTQSLVLAAACSWPLTYTVWADGFTQAYLNLPNGMQVVKTPTVKGLLERGLLARSSEDDDHLEVTLAGREALTGEPSAVTEASTPGWRLTVTSDRKVRFTVGGVDFLMTTSSWPNSTSADLMVEHVAHSMSALRSRTPDKFEHELAAFNAGTPSAFGAIAEESLDAVRLLHPEVAGHANNFEMRISVRR